MIKLKCQCGDMTVFTSAVLAGCETCEGCGRPFDPEFIAHDWQQKYNRETGAPEKECAGCGKIAVKIMIPGIDYEPPCTPPRGRPAHLGVLDEDMWFENPYLSDEMKERFEKEYRQQPFSEDELEAAGARSREAYLNAGGRPMIADNRAVIPEGEMEMLEAKTPSDGAIYKAVSGADEEFIDGLCDQIGVSARELAAQERELNEKLPTLTQEEYREFAEEFEDLRPLRPQNPQGE